MKNLQAGIKNDVDGIVNGVGIPVGYWALASMILNIILLIAVVVTASKSASKKDVENAVKHELSFQNSTANNADKISKVDLKNISDKVSRLGEDLRVFRTELTTQLKKTALPTDNKKKDIEPPEKKIIVAHGSYSSRPAPKSIEERCKPEYENFMREFNAFQSKLANMTDAREKRKEEVEFRQNHNIRTFKCNNVSARLRDPVPPPVFTDDDSQDAIFWAYKLPLGCYAVVAYTKNYADSIHGEQAMGDVFKSNFKPRKIYANVSVKTPAIFDIKLNLMAQGELVLSDG